MRFAFFTLAICLLIVRPAASADVEVAYFHDTDESVLQLRDIEFPSAKRGMAVGSVVEDTRERPVALVTSDGGRSWSEVRLPDSPVSVFCLDESACWLVGEQGVWFSSEAGRAWQRVSKEKLLTHVWFRTPQRGWAIGAKKKLLETVDGGRTWAKMAAAKQVSTSEDRTVFHALTFVTDQQAIIAGRVEPRRNDRFPVWMQSEPEEERETPTLSIVLESRDGGASWKATSSSMFGRISAIRARRGLAFAVALVEFERYFGYPSELFRIDMRTGDSVRIFREKGFAVTDVGVLPDGSVVAVGFEPAGSVARTPVPGRLRVMRSSDPAKWVPVEVDYRATARRVSAAVVADGTVWLATDTGMVLHYRPR
jgi:hypothetical protein